MYTAVYIIDNKRILKKIERFPYKTAAVTWLLLNQFEQQEDKWVNPFSNDVATIYSNLEESENDD
jgi:hypothetical protein